jgi:hypothetical protein
LAWALLSRWKEVMLWRMTSRAFHIASSFYQKWT